MCHKKKMELIREVANVLPYLVPPGFVPTQALLTSQVKANGDSYCNLLSMIFQ